MLPCCCFCLQDRRFFVRMVAQYAHRPSYWVVSKCVSESLVAVTTASLVELWCRGKRGAAMSSIAFQVPVVAR